MAISSSPPAVTLSGHRACAAVGRGGLAPSRSPGPRQRRSGAMPNLDQRSLPRQTPASTAARMAGTAAITATGMNPDFESGAGSHGAEFERVVGNSLGNRADGRRALGLPL